MQKERLNWIDVAKGIGIFLVVLGHNSIPPDIFGYIYCFHMPLFFFLSGFLFSTKNYPNFYLFFKRKVQTLLVPYVIFYFAIYIYWVVVVEKFWQHPSFDQYFLTPFLNFLYASNHIHDIITPVWFLPCLFLVSLIFYPIFRYLKKSWLILLGLIGSFILGLLLTKYVSVSWPWSINTALIAVLFYGVGFLVKQNIGHLTISFNRYLYLLASIVFFAILLWVFKANGTPDMLFNHYQNPILFILGAFLGILGTISLSLFLKHVAILEFIGLNSLVIFGLHSIGLAISKAIIGVALLPNDKESLLFGLIYSLMAILFVIPFVYLINRYFPGILGKRKP